MSDYKKFDLASVKARIKSDTYPNLTGANRAIGKTQGLSEEDRATLKKFAAKHFGADAPAATAPKKASKKAGKKAAKKAVAKPVKTAKKAAKVAKKTRAKRGSKKATAVAAPAAEPAPAPAVSEKPVAKAKQARGRKPAAVVGTAVQMALPFSPSTSSAEKTETVRLMGSVIGTCTDMLKSLDLAEKLFPKADMAESVATVTNTMTRAVAVINDEVVSPLTKPKTKEKAAAPAAKEKPAKRKPAAKEKPPEAVPADAGVSLDDLLNGASDGDEEEDEEAGEPSEASGTDEE